MIPKNKSMWGFLMQFRGFPKNFLICLIRKPDPQKKKAEAFSLGYMVDVKLLKLGLNNLI
jgi:hypothetical protein